MCSHDDEIDDAAYDLSEGKGLKAALSILRQYDRKERCDSHLDLSMDMGCLDLNSSSDDESE